MSVIIPLFEAGTDEVKCKATRYRWSHERDELQVKSPSGKTITVKLSNCSGGRMDEYRKFSDIIQDADGLGEFTTAYKWVDIVLTKDQMAEFLELSKPKPRK